MKLIKLVYLTSILIFCFVITISAQTDKGNSLARNAKLQLNECLTAGQNKLILKQDGNLVFMMGNTQVWESNTANQGVKELIFQDDCNAVLYKANNAGAAWSSGGLSRCAENAYLEVQLGGFGIMRGFYMTQIGSSVLGDSKTIYGNITPPDPNPNMGQVEP